MPSSLSQPTLANQANYPPQIAADVANLFSYGASQWIALPIAFGTANNAVLYTVPTGVRLYVHRAIWEVTTGFTGGTSSAIGLSSSNTGYNTAGDILGGASGDVAATLVDGITGGTIGAKFGSNGVIVLNAADTVKFNRITSAFTAGAGFAHLLVSALPTS